METSRPSQTLDEKAHQMLDRSVTKSLTPWRKFRWQRPPRPPPLQDYIEALFTRIPRRLAGRTELADDLAVMASGAPFNEHTVVVIGPRKVATTPKIPHRTQFSSMAAPEG